MNPFEIDPLQAGTALVDREDEADELIYRVTSGDMVLLEGPRGSGKTQLLKHVIDNFRGRGKVIYVDGERASKRLDINSLIYNKPRGMILLLDNVKGITKRNNEKIKYAFDEERIRSVVFTTDNRSDLTLTDSIMERINNNILPLEPYDAETVKEIVWDRGIEASDEVVARAYELLGNVKDVIRCIERTSEACLDKGKETIGPKDLVRPEGEHPHGPFLCEECGAELEGVNGVWRCPNCDEYCPQCGALLVEDEVDCPECGVEAR